MKNLRAIFILSLLGTKEWLRLKFVHLVAFVALLFIGFSHLLSSLTFSVQERLLYDFGLASLELSMVLVSSLIGSHAIHREIERKTLFVLLARPIPRWTIVMGAWGTLFILNIIFLLGFSVTFLKSGEFKLLLNGFLLACLTAVMKSFVISSVALAMGLLVRPILALGATILYWILCYSMPDVKFFVAKMQSEELMSVVNFLDAIIPQFYKFNWKSYYFLTQLPTQSEVMWMAAHSLGWTFFWLLVASLVFQRKEVA